MNKSFVLIPFVLFLFGCSRVGTVALSPGPEHPVAFSPSGHYDARTSSGTSDDTKRMGLTPESWLFGPGVGRTAANIGTSIAFPPYALYLLGNAGLSLAGLEEVHLTKALPGKSRGYALATYRELTSLPGRVLAAISRKPYREESRPDEAH